MKVVIDGKNYVPEPEAKEEKPEIRHGSYGHYKSGGLWWAWQRKDVLELFGRISGAGRAIQEVRSNIVIDGNHVDDLTGEDLEEFEVDNGYGRKLCFSLDCGDIFCVLKPRGERNLHIRLSAEKAKAIIKGLQRQILTLAKRKCKGKDC